MSGVRVPASLLTFLPQMDNPMGLIQRKYKGEWVSLEEFEKLTQQDAEEASESDSKRLEDHTKEELQEMLRERDMKVSGTKDELIERLRSE